MDQVEKEKMTGEGIPAAALKYCIARKQPVSKCLHLISFGGVCHSSNGVTAHCIDTTNSQ
jgi:hypothetical protein